MAYSHIPHDIMDNWFALSPAAKALAGSLGCFMSREGKCWPSKKELMRHAGIGSKESFTKAVKILRKYGLNVQRRRNHTALYSWDVDTQCQEDPVIRKTQSVGLPNNQEDPFSGPQEDPVSGSSLIIRYPKNVPTPPTPPRVDTGNAQTDDGGGGGDILLAKVMQRFVCIGRWGISLAQVKSFVVEGTEGMPKRLAALVGACRDPEAKRPIALAGSRLKGGCVNPKILKEVEHFIAPPALRVIAEDAHAVKARQSEAEHHQTEASQEFAQVNRLARERGISLTEAMDQIRREVAG